jgi:excisionase family DNA binding protein
MTDSPWLSTAEWCAYTKQSRATLYNKLKSGELVARKVGKRTLLSRAETDAMIEAGAVARAVSP